MIHAPDSGAAPARRLALVAPEPLAQALRNVLGAAPCRAYADGRSALSMLRSADPPDCLLLPFTLPDMDAPAFVRALRGTRSHLPCATVVLTAHPAELGRALAAGAHECLPAGPLGADQLAFAVESAVARHARSVAEASANTERAREAERRSLLVEVARVCLETPSADAALSDRVFALIRGHLRADVLFHYWLVGGTLHLLHGVGIPPELDHGARQLALGQAFCGTVAAERASFSADAERIASDRGGAFVHSMGVRAYACHPLLGRDGCVLGTFSVASTARTSFEPAEVEFLQAVCHLLALTWDRQRAEDALGASHDTFYNLIQNNPFGVYLVDTDFVLRQVSLGARRVFRTVSPLLGRSFDDVLRVIWPEPFASEAIQRFRHTLATGEPYLAPSTRERRADVGEVEAYDWRIERIVLPDGRFGVVCYFYDLTERTQLESRLRESESFYRQTLESIPGMVFTNTPDGACDYVSEQWAAFTGMAAAEHLGDGWQACLHPDDRSRASAAWRAAVAGEGSYDLEYRVRRKDGEYEWFKVRGRAIRDASGCVARWFGTATNIDGLKLAEAALMAADRHKDEFLATLAHELRNPLAPLRTGLQVLRMAAPESRAFSSAQDVMERQLAHMVRLVDDLLDLSRISRGQIALQRVPTRLSLIVHHAVEASQPLVEAHGHALRVVLPERDLYVDGDLTRLAQVFTNLLNNAAKYTPDGGHLTLTAELTGASVSVAVSDDGSGIPPEALPRVFEMFAQIDEHLHRAQGGLGIGLSLVQKLVAMHGGTVRAESAGRGRGSTFTVSLPVHAVAQAEAPRAPAPAPTQGHPGRRVLVVDDNVDGAESLAMLLGLYGHDTRMAHDGLEALDVARSYRPDLVFLDIGLPGMSGYEVAPALRAAPETAAAAIVALTGWGSDEDKQRTRAAGFDAHLTKPFDPSALRGLLTRFLPR